jgi:hypothetical protein
MAAVLSSDTQASQNCARSIAQLERNFAILRSELEKGIHMSRFAEMLHVQRWDDHRFYHQSRVNQSLHFFSACCFITTYVLLFTSPVIGVIFGWFIAMVSRQIGHFFFEPSDFDPTNNMSMQEKEEVKIGYNLRRKVVLLSAWAAMPIVLAFSPTLFGLLPSQPGWYGFLDNLSKAWLVLAGTALLGRSVFLFFIRDVETGVVWFCKILTDPFHDVYMYHKAPLALMRGELFDPEIYTPRAGGAGSVAASH